MEESSEARRKAELILKVRSGELSAAEAARELGVSRKTYYKWEKRALEGMVEALSDQLGGRPAAQTDRDKQALEQKSARLEKTVERLERTLKIRELLKPGVGDQPRSSKAEKKP